jgi:hypothetical protein
VGIGIPMSEGPVVGEGLAVGCPLDLVGAGDVRVVEGRGVGVGLVDLTDDGEATGGRVVRGRDRSARDLDGVGSGGNGSAVVGAAAGADGDAVTSSGAPATQPGASSPITNAAAAVGPPNTSTVAQRGIGTPRRTRCRPCTTGDPNGGVSDGRRPGMRVVLSRSSLTSVHRSHR